MEAARNASVKALLSSRPIPACVHHFENCPQLRLQDLTRGDIHHYVSDCIGNHALLKRMETAHPGIAARLVNQVTDRASGVFLWVILVVRSLRVGLQNYNTAAELMEDVDVLPPDLEKLYDHMLGSMSPRNRLLGSQFLQLVLRHMDRESDFPLSLLQVSYAQDYDYDKCLAAPIQALAEGDANWRCETTEGRLRSRCCGLVEATHWTTSNCERPVQFIHRTVLEFLRIDTVWDKLTQLTRKTPFDPDMALVNSAILDMKTRPTSIHDWRNDMRKISYYYHDALPDRHKQAFRERYLPEAVKTSRHQRGDRPLFASSDQEAEAINSSLLRACTRMNLNFLQSCQLYLLLHGAPEDALAMFYERDARPGCPSISSRSGTHGCAAQLPVLLSISITPTVRKRYHSTATPRSSGMIGGRPPSGPVTQPARGRSLSSSFNTASPSSIRPTRTKHISTLPTQSWRSVSSLSSRAWATGTIWHRFLSR